MDRTLENRIRLRAEGAKRFNVNLSGKRTKTSKDFLNYLYFADYAFA